MKKMMTADSDFVLQMVKNAPSGLLSPSINLNISRINKWVSQIYLITQTSWKYEPVSTPFFFLFLEIRNGKLLLHKLDYRSWPIGKILFPNPDFLFNEIQID